MAKRISGGKPGTPQTPAYPDCLTMQLFAPGMTALHRAGLGGLASTLKAMEREYEAGRLRVEQLPGPTINGFYPWEISEDSVSLRFGNPEHAGDYLNRLFAFAFQTNDTGLIYLPGQHFNRPPDAVLGDLQAGFTLTFLQHGRVRTLDKNSTTVGYDLSDRGIPNLIVEYRRCVNFRHQCGWEELVDRRGRLIQGVIKVDGPISPGTVVRHVAFTGDTGVEDPPARVLPLFFALVGCLSLSVNRGVAALIVPVVENLIDFSWDRPAMTPTVPEECQIANAADAGFRAQVRVRAYRRRDLEVKGHARSVVEANTIPACYVMTFTPTPWASQQKSRVATITVPPGDDALLDRYQRAAGHLPSRIVTRQIRETTGRGRQRAIVERQETFRSESIVRPLVAENLALGRKWYSGFVSLMTKINPATDTPFRDRLPFERGGLHAMISDDMMWDTASERVVVQAVHEALRMRYGQIADENQTNQTAMRNRFSGEYDRWRLAFSGAKTVDQFRRSLCDLFSRAGRNQVLQSQWTELLPMLRQNNWQHTRDLALLALCSYQSNRTDSNQFSNSVNPQQSP